MAHDREPYVIPDLCGAYWWAQLHSWAENIRTVGCRPCGEFAVDAAVALHDVVNHHLDKPIQDPANLERIATYFADASMGRSPIAASTVSGDVQAAARPFALGIVTPLSVMEQRPDSSLQMEMAAPFGWPGGKRNLKKRILELIPPHRIYVEPFAGAASVFWAKPHSDVEVLNDIDPDLIRFYRNLHKIENCDIQRLAQDWDRLKAKRGKLTPCEFLTTVDCSFGSGGFSKGRATKRPTCQSGAKAFHDNLSRYQQRLHGVKIHCEDWEATVWRYDAADTFFYLDPPYHGQSANLYYRDDDQLDRLAGILKGVKGKWLLSFNDHPAVHKAFAWAQITPVHGTYTISADTNEQPAAQLFIANYPLNVEAISAAQEPTTFLGFVRQGAAVGFGAALAILTIEWLRRGGFRAAQDPSEPALSLSKGPVIAVDAPADQGGHLSPEALLLDVSGSGEFVSERVADPTGFSPESIRTVVNGDHRTRVGCPKGQFFGETCAVATRAQSILHPRVEADELVRQAEARGIEVITGPEEQWVLRDLIDVVAPDLELAQ